MTMPMKAIRMENPSISYLIKDEDKVPKLLLKHEPNIIYYKDKCATSLIKNYLDDIIGTKKEKKVTLQQFNNCCNGLSRLTLKLKDSKTLEPTTSGEILETFVDTNLQMSFLTYKKCKKYFNVTEDICQSKTMSKKSLKMVAG